MCYYSLPKKCTRERDLKTSSNYYYSRFQNPNRRYSVREIKGCIKKEERQFLKPFVMVLFLSYSQWKDRLIHWLFTALDREYSIYGKIPLWNWEEMTDIQCNIYYWNIHNDSMKTCIQTKYQFRNWMHSVGMLKKGWKLRIWSLKSLVKLRKYLP